VWAARYLRSKPGQEWRQRGLALVAGEAPKPDFVPTTHLARGALDVSLTVGGALKAETTVQVTSTTSGTMQPAIEDGTPKKRGQLASAENQKQAEVNHARFAADLAVRRIGDEVRNAQQNVDTTKKQWTDLADQLKQSTIIAPSDGVAILDQRWDGALRPLRAG